MRQRGSIERQLVTEAQFTAEELVIRVLQPARTAPRPTGRACASLFGQPRSSAFGPSCVVTSTYPSGFSLLSGIGPIGPSMMGSEERSGTIFKASFVLTKLKEQHMHRTHFVPRPARDNSPLQ